MIASLMGIEILNISVALHDWQRGEWSHLEWRIEAITALSLLHKDETKFQYGMTDRRPHTQREACHLGNAA